MSFEEIGYVLTVRKDTKIATIYCKRYPNIEIFFDCPEELSDILKPGNVVSFKFSDELRISNEKKKRTAIIFSADEQKLKLIKKKVDKIYPKELTKYFQIQFVTEAIFTVDSSDDNCLLENDVHAVGFSEDFGRFVVTQDFDNSENVEFEAGKLYKVIINRYAPGNGQKYFARWNTILVCDKVLSIEENFEAINLINSLQEKCPWSQHTSPIIPPKRVLTQEAQINKAKIAKIEMKEDESTRVVCISFGLVVEKTENFTLIFAPAYQSFYRLSNKVELSTGSVYALKLADEIGGVFQKVSENKVSSMDTVRSITRGIIEGIFDVELCSIADPLFPPPWTFYGDTRCLGKVMIPSFENIPPIGSNLKVRAIFLNKPVGDFCWTYTGLLSSSPKQKVENFEVAEKLKSDRPTLADDTLFKKEEKPAFTTNHSSDESVVVKKPMITRSDGMSARSFIEPKRSPASDSESDNEDEFASNSKIAVKTEPSNDVQDEGKLTPNSSISSSIVVIEKPTSSQSEDSPTELATSEIENNDENDIGDEYQTSSDSDFNGEFGFGVGEDEPIPNAIVKISKGSVKESSSEPEKNNSPTTNENNNHETTIQSDHEEFNVMQLDAKTRSMILVTDSEGEDELDISICSGLQTPDEFIEDVTNEDPVLQVKKSDSKEDTLDSNPTSSNSCQSATSKIPKSFPTITQDSDDPTTDEDGEF